jgi:hypothetical protein
MIMAIITYYAQDGNQRHTDHSSVRQSIPCQSSKNQEKTLASLRQKGSLG